MGATPAEPAAGMLLGWALQWSQTELQQRKARKGPGSQWELGAAEGVGRLETPSHSSAVAWGARSGILAGFQAGALHQPLASQRHLWGQTMSLLHSRCSAGNPQCLR